MTVVLGGRPRMGGGSDGGTFPVSVVLKLHYEPLPEGKRPDDDRGAAFEELFRRCYPPLVDLCHRTLSGRGDPEAMAQESLMRAWASLERFNDARPFWPWVATVARRLCIDTRRRVLRESSLLPAHVVAVERQPLTPEDAVEADEERRSARLALGTLTPTERRIVMLREVGGCSYDEIADAEGVSVEAVRGLLKRARRSLRTSYTKLA